MTVGPLSLVSGCGELGSDPVGEVSYTWFGFPRPQSMEEIVGVVGSAGGRYARQDVDGLIALGQNGVQVRVCPRRQVLASTTSRSL